MACFCCWASSRYSPLPDYDDDGKSDGVYKPAGSDRVVVTLLQAKKTPPANSTSSNDAVSNETNPLVDNARVLKHVSSFACAEGYIFVAGVSRKWRAAWNERFPRTTNRSDAARSVSRLAWSKDCGLPWDEKTAGYAAVFGGLEAIKYVRSQGCPWNEATCSMTAATGQLAVLRQDITVTVQDVAGYMEIFAHVRLLGFYSPGCCADCSLTKDVSTCCRKLNLWPFSVLPDSK